MKKVLKILAAVVVLIAVVFIGYLEIGHYKADDVAALYTMTSEKDDYITYDNGSNTGFIFYPGAKVESSAYSYLSQINANVYIAKFPFEMAMFDYKVANQIIADHPEITKWYIGGHSLGGVFANRYAVTTDNQIDGIIYLGSYPADGDQSNIPSIALFGDQDLVVGDYTEKTELFTDATEVIVLENANHSGFGNYGQQKGDSELSAEDKEEQQATIIEEINKFIKVNK